MQTYNSEQFMKLLVCACPNTYHDKAHEEPNEYIVWTELGENSFRAEGVDEYAERYSVTVYTKEKSAKSCCYGYRSCSQGCRRSNMQSDRTG